MIFWALITLTIAATIFFVVREAREWYGDPILAGIVSLVIGTVVSFITFGICAINMKPITETLARNDTYQLRALGDTTGIQGRSYFLGGGYVNSKRVLNYITDENGAIRLGQVNADDATIYENATKPTLTISHKDQYNGWLAPFPFPTNDTYDFHVPAGSVLSDYQVTNK